MLLNHLLSVTFLQMLQSDVTKSHKCSSDWTWMRGLGPAYYWIELVTELDSYPVQNMSYPVLYDNFIIFLKLCAKNGEIDFLNSQVVIAMYYNGVRLDTTNDVCLHCTNWNVEYLSSLSNFFSKAEIIYWRKEKQ
jgi:hypothetical protein